MASFRPGSSTPRRRHTQNKNKTKKREEGAGVTSGILLRSAGSTALKTKRAWRKHSVSIIDAHSRLQCNALRCTAQVLHCRLDKATTDGPKYVEREALCGQTLFSLEQLLTTSRQLSLFGVEGADCLSARLSESPHHHPKKATRASASTAAVTATAATLGALPGFLCWNAGG